VRQMQGKKRGKPQQPKSDLLKSKRKIHHTSHLPTDNGGVAARYAKQPTWYRSSPNLHSDTVARTRVTLRRPASTLTCSDVVCHSSNDFQRTQQQTKTNFSLTHDHVCSSVVCLGTYLLHSASSSNNVKKRLPKVRNNAYTTTTFHRSRDDEGSTPLSQHRHLDGILVKPKLRKQSRTGIDLRVTHFE